MKIDRLVSIIMILLDKKRIGAQELADLFEVSPRTIYRDIDAINRAFRPFKHGAKGGSGACPAKVKSFIPAEQAGDIEYKVNQINIDLSQWSENRNTHSCWERIQSALWEKRLLLFEYVAHHGNKTIRTAVLMFSLEISMETFLILQNGVQGQYFATYYILEIICWVLIISRRAPE